MTCPAEVHGTVYAYKKRGCVCPEALRANARDMNVRRAEWDRGITRRVDATGTRRRLQALACLGWSWGDIGQELGGLTGTAVGFYSRRAQVHRDTAEAVREVYDRLYAYDGPNPEAARRAARKGWLPPEWWDDDRMDDPAYDPRREVSPAKQLREEEQRQRVERARRLHEQDRLPLREIAAELGLTTRQVCRYLRRQEAS